MFLKYRSIENLHNITEYLDPNILVTVSEKIDGSNFSICLEPDGSYEFASRNHIRQATWNELGSLVPQSFLDHWSEIAQKGESKINLFGEVFSDRILRRFYYGEPRVRFYDVAIDGKYQSQLCFLTMMRPFTDLIVKHTICKLAEAIKIDVEHKMSVYDTSATVEGIVIKGYYTELINKWKESYAIKKKGKRFMEKTSTPRVPTTPEVLTPIQRELLTYVNSNRVLSAESKIGGFHDKRIGAYMKEIAKDSVADFLKANPCVPKKDYMSKAFMNMVKSTLFKQYGMNQ